MNWTAINFDWNQLRAFLATVEEGSLSAAARALDLTQPTLSRQVSALEESLGLVLFERSRHAMTLTQAGIELVEHVETMRDAAIRVSLTASGQSQEIKGVVSITATDMVTTYLLPEMLGELQAAAPGLKIELIPSNEVQDLNKREADIAIRHVSPEQPDLIAKKIGQASAYLYAAPEYLARHAQPMNKEQICNADFIGLGQIERFLPMINSLGLPLTTDNFNITTTGSAALMELVKQGLGISILPHYIGNKAPELQRLIPDTFSAPVPIWLVTHKELRSSRRIRLVYDFLAEKLRDI